MVWEVDLVDLVETVEETMAAEETKVVGSVELEAMVDATVLVVMVVAMVVLLVEVVTVVEMVVVLEEVVMVATMVGLVDLEVAMGVAKGVGEVDLDSVVVRGAEETVAFSVAEMDMVAMEVEKEVTVETVVVALVVEEVKVASSSKTMRICHFH